ncbi:MAG: PDZ domain-containing protein, partial [Calditrichaeota bacterium]|nr:PDZ domain-containing protein [Calditrichota bacterium]
MNQDLKIWKISLFLLLGLFVFVYIVSSTVADVYFLINNPVVGLRCGFDTERSQAVVQHVVPRGPADMAGLKEGDIVLSINARSLRTAEDLEKELYPDIRPGEPVRFKVFRDNQEIDFTVESESHIKVYTRSFFQGLLPGVAFSYSLCLIGLFVLLKKIDDRVGHIFFLMVMFWALAMWGEFSPGTPALYKVLPGWFTWISLLFWPLAVGLLLHFALIFPVEKQSFARHKPWFFLLMYGSV